MDLFLVTKASEVTFQTPLWINLVNQKELSLKISG